MTAELPALQFQKFVFANTSKDLTLACRVVTILLSSLRVDFL